MLYFVMLTFFKNVSKANMAKSLGAVVEEVKKVENKFPPKSKRLIEIEV